MQSRRFVNNKAQRSSKLYKHTTYTWMRYLHPGLQSRCRSRIFVRLQKSSCIIFHMKLLSREFLLKWYNFFWNFCWNREFLLCITISIHCWLLQNCWQPNFICFMKESESLSGVGAGKFLEVGMILPEFPLTCPKSFCATFAYNFLPERPWRPLFLVWPPENVFMCFSANVGRYFRKSNNAGRRFCSDFQGFCPDFQGFCPDF